MSQGFTKPQIKSRIVPQAARVLVVEAADRAVARLHVPCEGRGSTGDDPQQRGLAGAIGPDDAYALAASDAQVYAVEEDVLAISAAQAARLKHELSAKAQEGAIVVIDTAEADGKTKVLAKLVKDLGWKRALIIDGAEVNENFAKAARNIEGLDVLPSMGANVYDILKRDTLVLTKAGVEALEARLK